ncbi:uncharacterized protein [Triticum aestivum]|uniref:uncharacterized protein isoform X2 n=1 Tax=Triticum aestivum TaxID=4565 RepID=UPI001D02E556|nr:uncharacterized protein LOC123164179 isoform X2 [Triticum aestivum]
MALRTLAARTRSAALHLAPRSSPPATIGASPSAPRVLYSKPAVISMAIPAATASALLLSPAFSSPAIRGTSLISTAQAHYFSTSAVEIDPMILKKLLAEQLNCSGISSNCLLEIQTVKYLQALTLILIVSGVGGVYYIGQNLMDRGSEITGQLKKHAPEILGDICNEALFQMKIPFIGSKESRFELKDYWFNDPNKSLSRQEQRARRALAIQEKDRIRREEFKRAEEERKRAAAPLYEQYMARKDLNDMKVMEQLREERMRHEERMRRLSGNM